MKSERYEACGESLCEETITNDTVMGKVVIYPCAQNREAGSPERGLLMPISDEERSFIADYRRLNPVKKAEFISYLQGLLAESGNLPCVQETIGDNT